MTHVLIPREPNAVLLRPFTGCPADELPLAWAAMIRAAEVQNARAGAAPAAVAPLPAVLEQIAQGWDGCMYDAPGETLDIGADIRAAAKRLLAEQPAPVSGPVLDVRAIAAAVCQRVAELPDRNSPEDWPVAMLVTGQELIDVVTCELEQAQAAPALEAPAAPAGDEEAAFTKWFQGEQGKPYQGMWEFARAAWMARAAAPQAPAVPVAVTTRAELEKLQGGAGSMATIFPADASGFPVRLYAEPAAPAVDADGARYRYLRDEHIGDDPESINLPPARKSGLDAAVDAAIAAQAAAKGAP